MWISMGWDFNRARFSIWKRDHCGCSVAFEWCTMLVHISQTGQTYNFAIQRTLNARQRVKCNFISFERKSERNERAWRHKISGMKSNRIFCLFAKMMPNLQAILKWHCVWAVALFLRSPLACLHIFSSSFLFPHVYGIVLSFFRLFVCSFSCILFFTSSLSIWHWVVNFKVIAQKPKCNYRHKQTHNTPK